MSELKKYMERIINRRFETAISFLNSDYEKNTTDKKFMMKAIELSQFMKRNGIKERENVIIQVNDEEEYLLTIWAGIIGDFVLIPLPRVNLSKKNKEKIFFFNVRNSLKNFFIVHDFSEDEEIFLEINLQKSLNIKKFCENYEEKKVTLDLKNRNDSDVFLILYTSGSTNDPKGVEISYEMIISNVIEIGNKLHLNNNDKVFIWTPLTHVLGLVLLHFTSFFLGIEQIILSTDEFMINTAKYMREISLRNCSITAFPPFMMSYIYDVLKYRECLLKEIDISCIKCIITGTEYISYSVLQKFINLEFKKKICIDKITPFYGMTETGVIISLKDINQKLGVLNMDEFKQLNKKSNFSFEKIISCGSLSEDIEVAIKMENEQITKEESIVGEILIRGRRVFKRYFGHIPREVDEYFQTGDIGFLYENNLFITGRKKDIFISNGKNYHLNDIEVLCTEIKNISYEDVVAFFIIDKEEKEKLVIGLARKVKNECHDIENVIKKLVFFNCQISIKDIFFLEYIPVTVSGKKRRNYVKEVYLDERNYS